MNTFLAKMGHPGLRLALAVLGLSACAEEVGTPPPAVPSSTANGGAAGTACGQDGALGCAPGLARRVRCESGKWVESAVCSTGSACTETMAGTTVTATHCAWSAFDDPGRVIACAKMQQCENSLFGMERCATYPKLIAPGVAHLAKVGGFLSVGKAVSEEYLIPAQLNCLANATSCDAVKACVDGPLGPCQTSTQSGCQGAVGWWCSDTRKFMDCATVGMQCSMAGGSAHCVLPSSQCKPGVNGIVCAGEDAHVCVSKSGVETSWIFHCGALGMTCDANAKIDDDALEVCQPKVITPCDAAIFKMRCDGNSHVRCKHGREVARDCGWSGETCEVGKISTDTPQANWCQTPKWPDCTGGPTCDGNSLAFCSLGKRVSVDCKKFGLSCGEYSGQGGSDTCKFP
ncbi:MAG: hypothetical protein EXR77_18245 [Myxococcales bacterium]|nr:hypothetical protein [Myxococcales bacterium]